MKNFAVIGKPVSHSLSPVIHQNFAKQFAMNITYEKFAVDEANFDDFVINFFACGGDGLNITLPYKFKALNIAQEITNAAKSSTVANTLKKQDNGNISACNTDGPGLIKDLNKRHMIKLENSSILILGAGGASTGIMYSIMQNQPKRIIVANRTKEKADKLCNYYQKFNNNSIDLQSISLEEVANQSKFDLIINTTSAGHSDNLIQIDDNVLQQASFIYDLSYGDATNKFFAKLKNLNITNYADGLGMLIEQASLSFAYWLNEMPSTEEIYQELRSKY